MWLKRSRVRLPAVPRWGVATCASVTKQYNLLPARPRRWCPEAGKVTVGLASHWPCVADFSGLGTYGLSLSEPKEERCLSTRPTLLVMGYGTLYLHHRNSRPITPATAFYFYLPVQNFANSDVVYSCCGQHWVAVYTLLRWLSSCMLQARTCCPWPHTRLVTRWASVIRRIEVRWCSPGTTSTTPSAPCTPTTSRPSSTSTVGHAQLSCCTVLFCSLAVLGPIVGHTKVKSEVFPYSLPSVGPGADPGVQAVSPQVMWSESRHRPGSRPPLLSAKPTVTSIAFTRWRYL